MGADGQNIFPLCGITSIPIIIALQWFRIALFLREGEVPPLVNL